MPRAVALAATLGLAALAAGALLLTRGPSTTQVARPPEPPRATPAAADTPVDLAQADVDPPAERAPLGEAAAPELGLEERLAALAPVSHFDVEVRAVNVQGFALPGLTVLAGAADGVVNRVGTTDRDGRAAFRLCGAETRSELAVALTNGESWSGFFLLTAYDERTFLLDVEYPEGGPSLPPSLAEAPLALALSDGARLLRTNAAVAKCERPIPPGTLTKSDVDALFTRLLYADRISGAGVRLRGFTFTEARGNLELQIALDGAAMPPDALKLMFQERLAEEFQKLANAQPEFLVLDVDVIGPSGRPAPFYPVQVRDAHGTQLSIIEADDEGKLHVELAAGEYHLHAGTPKRAYAALDVVGEAGEHRALVMRLDAGRVLELAIDLRQRRAREQRYELEVSSANALWIRRAGLDGSTLSFYHVPPGRARLFVYAPENTSAVPDRIEPVPAGALLGEPAELSLPLPAPAGLTLWTDAVNSDEDPLEARLIDDEAGRALVLEPGAADGESRLSATHGAPLRVARLPGRTLRVVARNRGAGTVSDLVLDAQPRLEGTSVGLLEDSLSPGETAFFAASESWGPERAELWLHAEKGAWVAYALAGGEDERVFALPPGTWWPPSAPPPGPDAGRLLAPAPARGSQARCGACHAER